jgi:hypothetical protein
MCETLQSRPLNIAAIDICKQVGMALFLYNFIKQNKAKQVVVPRTTVSQPWYGS